LIDALRRESLLPEGALASALDKTAQSDVRIGDHYPQITVEVSVLKYVALFDKRCVIINDAFGPENILLVTVDLDAVACYPGPNVQFGFDQADVFVSGPKQRLDAGCKRNLYRIYRNR